MTESKDIDKGYAWVALASSWMLMVIANVVYYSAGVVNAALLETFGDSVVKTSWVSATMLGTFMFSGPISGFMVKTFGCRVTGHVGGVLLMGGMVAASFSKNIDSLIVAYGLGAGLGASLTTTASNIMVGYYFHRHLPLAAGLQMSGGGAGMIISAPIIRYLIDSYSIDGMFLILGGLGLNSCVGAMLMRPAPPESLEVDVECPDSSSNDIPQTNNVLCPDTSDSMELGSTEARRDLQETKDKLLKCENQTDSEEYDKAREQSSKLLPAQEPSSSLIIKMHQVNSNTDRLEGKQRGKLGEYFSCRNQCQEYLKVLTNLSYMTYVLSVAFWSLGVAVFFVYLPTLVESHGTSKQQSALLYTIMGVASVAARLLSGFAGNDPAIGSIIMHIGMIGVSGVVMFLYAVFNQTYAEQVGLAVFLGIYNGGPMALVNPITVELVGRGGLATGYAISNLFGGCALLAGPPLAGVIYERTQSYAACFMFAGGVLLLGSIVFLPVASFRQRSQTQSHMDSDTKTKPMLSEL